MQQSSSSHSPPPRGEADQAFPLGISESERLAETLGQSERRFDLLFEGRAAGRRLISPCEPLAVQPAGLAAVIRGMGLEMGADRITAAVAQGGSSFAMEKALWT